MAHSQRQTSQNQPIRGGPIHPYQLRRGAATYAVLGTNASPSIASVARRGDWPLGHVLDRYWHWHSSNVGDENTDPNNVEFATLPPH